MTPRAAIVGTGYVARVHAHALRELGVRVAAVCGRSTTQELADELGATPYDDLGRLLETERPEVLHVCTPNSAHAEQTLLALEQRIHVVCEKPLAVTSTEAAEMTEAASLAGLVAACCYHCRGYPLVRRMREVYAERLSVLWESATQRLSGLLDVSRVEAGLQTVGWLLVGTASAASKAATARDVEAIPLDVYFRGRPSRQGLHLGFAAVDPVELRRGVRELERALATRA